MKFNTNVEITIKFMRLTRVTFRRHLHFFPLVPGFFQKEGGAGRWRGGAGEAGSRLKVLFCSVFSVFTWFLLSLLKDVNCVMNSQFSPLLKNMDLF